ncbi:MAG: DEAD/DEAH box helicase family protein [Anaerolineales bacterium]|nr:DEAD/DEAH box helicase family protein [Anaerolineales bacterium]
MTDIIAIDLETTGLDSKKDAIIEVGAVRFNNKRVQDEWSTLINPGRHIPDFISNLTGITDSMVRQAPSIQDVIAELAAFIGEAPVLGHNIRFDLSFLQRYGLCQNNQVIDTYELASVLMPAASRYNLGALGQILGIPLPATHRALDDARVTQAVFSLMYEKAMQLPLDLLAEITRLGEPLAWDANWTFQQALKARAKEGITPKKTLRSSHAPLFETRQGQYPPLQSADEPAMLDPEEVTALLEHGGPFSKYFENFESRPEQLEMLSAVTTALSTGQHLMVEAGTGVGKSFAYLVPAALFALENNTRVVVSTNTINLQDQLIKKDIPDMKAAIGLEELRASVLKGRGNYLCPRRLEFHRQHAPTNAEEVRILAKILVWLTENQSGDRNEINLTGPIERDLWRRLSAEDDACDGDTCMKRMGGVCPFFQARQAAQSAHILIVNHALLLADVAAGSRVLPEYDYLIVDEAHHLESATTNALSFRLTQNELERILREIGSSSSGTLGRMISELAGALRPSDHAQLGQMVKRATDLAFRVEHQCRDFFITLGEFAHYQREGRPQNNYAWQERILPATRTQQTWEEVEVAWDAAGETLNLLLNALSEIHKAAAELYAEGLDELEDFIGDLGNLYRRLLEIASNLNALIFEPSAQQVYWIEVQPNGQSISLNAAPLHVGSLIEKHIWHPKTSVILTSATLTTRGEFTYMRNTLNAADADELALGSPYDYESSTLLYLPNDIPEPNAQGFQHTLDRSLIQLCQATSGRALVLFTSYAQLKRTSQTISGPLADQDIIVYEQGEGASPNTLLETFKSTERAVLLGTRSFWEGVDVPGQALSVLVIVKLPFDVPSDPLIAARAETYEDHFGEYYLPEAILKFRQGFGRLIRSQYDHGVVVLMDRRLQTKQYGRHFIDSLPRCTMKVGPINQLPREAGRWLGT